MTIPSYTVLGSRVDAVQIPAAIEQMERWIAARDGCRYVCVSNVNNLVEGRRDPSFRRITNEASLSLADGMPLVWAGRLRGFAIPRRCAGPDLFLEFFRATAGRNYRHFFYGGAADVAEELANVLQRRFGIIVAGAYAPPYRPLTPEEDDQVVELINCSRADVLWVGLGCPKQERWMFEHHTRLRVPVMLGVGQVFDIYTGRIRRAPHWFCEHGLEWLWRFASEPRRLWRRYLVGNAEFLSCFFLEFTHLRRFEP